MNGFEIDIDIAMIAVRTVHFAATAITAGALTFRAVVAGPDFRAAREAGAVIDAQVRPLAWSGLAVTVVSGAIWLALQTVAMSGQTFGEAMTSGAF
jgi:putative copper resistance protein D